MPDQRTPSEHSQASRIGAQRSWARTSDPAARTAPARTAFLARFEDEVDPDRVLPTEERSARARLAAGIVTSAGTLAVSVEQALDDDRGSSAPPSYLSPDAIRARVRTSVAASGVAERVTDTDLAEHLARIVRGAGLDNGGDGQAA